MTGLVRWFTCQTRRIYVDFGEGVVGGGVAIGSVMVIRRGY